MRKTMPEISIVMPTYNSESSVNEALEAIFNLDYDLKRVELLLVDGCSKDDTLEILKEMEKRSPLNSFKLVQVASNIPEARNRGIQLAQGDYVCFIDSDVVVPKDFLSRLMVYMEEKDVGGVMGYPVYTRNSLLTNLIRSKKGKNPWYFMGRKIRNADVLTCMCTLYKADLVKDIRLSSDQIRGEDAEIAISVRKEGYRLVWDGSVVCEHIKRLTVRTALREWFNDGRGRALLVLKHWRTERRLLKSSLRYLMHLAIPTSFVASALSFLGAPGFATTLLRLSPLIVIASFYLYLLSTFRGAKQKILYPLPNMLFNLAFSLGLLHGFMKRVFGG